jgi:hypothetical protein
LAKLRRAISGTKGTTRERRTLIGPEYLYLSSVGNLTYGLTGSLTPNPKGMGEGDLRIPESQKSLHLQHPPPHRGFNQARVTLPLKQQLSP